MARLEFKQLTDGEPLQIVSVRHADGLAKSYISTGNEYTDLTSEDLGEAVCDNPVADVLAVECLYSDAEHQINVNDDFDGTVEFQSKAMICHELIGSRPATRPHK